MAKLTTGQRNALAPSSFVFPKQRAFPINDPSHARAALSQAPKKGPAVVAKVKAAVKAKFPSIGKPKTRGL